MADPAAGQRDPGPDVGRVRTVQAPGYALPVLPLLLAALAHAADPAVTTRAFVFTLGGAAGLADIAPEPGHHYILSLSPASSGTWEFGGERLRLAVTACVTPTYLYAPGEQLAFPSLAESRVGFLADLDGFRLGGDLFLGLISAGVGLHAGALPWTGPRGIRHGLDVRLDLLAGAYTHPRLMVQYAWTPWARFAE